MDAEVRRFVEKCLATVSSRLTARELLNDPFLQIDDYRFDSSRLEYYTDFNGMGPMLRQPLLQVHCTNGSLTDGFYANYLGYEPENEFDYHPHDFERNEIELFTSQDDERLENVDITIKGKRREDDGIFLRLRMADKEGLNFSSTKMLLVSIKINNWTSSTDFCKSNVESIVV